MTLAALAAAPGVAAERLVVKVGPLSQVVELSDLETFARTGQVPPNLRLYQRFLSPQVQLSLQQTLDLDPQMGDRMIEEILASANGDLLLEALTAIAPNLGLPQLQAAIRLAASQTHGLSVLGILRAIPQETLELDLSTAIALVSQFNLSALESRSLSGLLEQELAVDGAVALANHLDPTMPGLLEVSQRTLTLRDLDRQRVIPVEVHWSRDLQDQTVGPMVVLSHGFGADRFFLDYIAKHLASHGLTVVSVEHPGSNVQALLDLSLDPDMAESPSRLLPATEFLDRPRDITFVLDRLTQISQGSSFYKDLFNTEDVTIIGHSLGGYTGLALAGARLDLRSLQSFCQNIQPLGISPADWLQCAAVDLPEPMADLRDDRIQQVIAMNPLIGKLFGEAGLSQVTVPTLLLTGTQDSVTPTLDQQLRPFTQLAGPKYLLAVIGGTHLSVGDPNNVNPALSDLPFMSELPVAETAQLRRLLQGLTLSFVQQRSPEAAQYSPFLSPAYVQSFSTPMLPLRLTQTLPSSIRSWLAVTTRISANKQPTIASRLIALSYLQALDNRHQWQQAMAVHLQANHVVTVLRSPFPWLPFPLLMAP
ncbi:MAG: alpha/beta fold hydrolase [Phormidesmis sp. RL_2_1]|nr:alpha/beta fold hydrolase [Phormidesmis sp. RL_2_1]